MKQAKTTSYLALLLALTLAWGGAASVGQSLARMEGLDTVADTVLRAPTTGAVTSDCLVSGGKQTVLLGKLQAGKSLAVKFNLNALGPVSGELKAAASENTPLSIAWTVEGAVQTEDGLLQMEAGTQAAVTMTITAPEQIESAITELLVTFGDLESVFRVELEPAPAAQEITEEEPSEEDPTEEEPSEEDPTEEEPTEEEPVEEEPVEETPAEQQTAETVTTDPVTGEEPNEEETITEPEPVVLTLAAPAGFESNSCLPLKLTVSGPAERVYLGIDTGNVLPALPAFPAGTRFSIDGGGSWYLLYYGGYMEIAEDFSNAESTMILLELPQSALTLDAALVLTAWNDDPLLGVYVETYPTAARERSDAMPILTSPTPEALEALEIALGLRTPEEVPATEPVTEQEEQTEEEPATEVSEPVQQELTAQEPEWNSEFSFAVPLPAGWVREQLRFTAEMLTVSEEGIRGYVPLSWSADSLNAVIHEQTENLIVYVGANAPMAGTYRLTLECIYEGTCFRREQTTFFINYSTRSDVQSEEVPNNE